MKKQGGQPNNSSGTTTGAQPDASTLLQNLLDSAKEPSFSIDRHYRYTSFNRTHASVMKMIYGMDIRVGMSLLECMTVVQDRETAKKNLDQVLASGDELVAHDYSGEEARSRRYFEVSHRPVKDAPGNMIGVMVTARDITGERQSADKLRESEDKFRSLFMLGPDAFYLATLEDGRFIEVNEGLTKLCGYTRDDLP
jgi:PAS domain S-box-containing protein